MENIMDFMSAALHGNALSQLSSQMHESPAATRRGFETAMPAAFAALASYGSSSGKAEELVGAIRGGNYPHVDLDQVGEVTSNPDATARIAQSSSGFLNRIFGNRLDGAIDAIAGTSGIGRSSASTLLGLAAPLVMGFVGKQVTSRNLDARGFGGWLAEQGRKAVSLLPGPLATALGATTAFGDVGRAAAQPMNQIRAVGGDVSHGTYAQRPRSKGAFWWVLGAIAVTLFAWQMLRAPRMQRGTEAPRVMQDTTRPQEPTIVPHGSPDQMAVAAAGGAAALTALLKNDEPLPAKMKLDQVQFASGSSAISSNRALDDMATALKSHEGARVRLEGFADATGTPAANERLAQARAQAVKDYLVAEGVPAENIETAGQASDAPAASGRAEDRRVELTLLSR